MLVAPPPPAPEPEPPVVEPEPGPVLVAPPPPAPEPVPPVNEPESGPVLVAPPPPAPEPAPEPVAELPVSEPEPGPVLVAPPPPAPEPEPPVVEPEPGPVLVAPPPPALEPVAEPPVTESEPGPVLVAPPPPAPEPEPEPPIEEPPPSPLPEPEPEPVPVPPVHEPDPEPVTDESAPGPEPPAEPLPPPALTMEPSKPRPGPTLVRPPAPVPRLVPDPQTELPRPVIVRAADAGDAWPFGLTPDPDFFYRSRQHAEALALLHYGVVGRKGYIMLTGESGMGKTMVMECLTDKLSNEDVEFAYVFNSKLTRQELFELLAIDFELPISDPRKTAVLMALNDKLIDRAQRGQVTALLVDDAQKLTTDVLEEIELLGNLETRKGKLLQVVISARPEFERMLLAPELRGFRQRFVLRSRLGPLTERETYEYIDFRMSRVDGPWKMLLPERLWPDVFRVTHGVPRIISAVCGRLLELDSVATPASIDQVVAEFGLED